MLDKPTNLRLYKSYLKHAGGLLAVRSNEVAHPVNANSQDRAVRAPFADGGLRASSIQLALAVIAACCGIDSAFQYADKACKCTLGLNVVVQSDRIVLVAGNLVREDFPK